MRDQVKVSCNGAHFYSSPDSFTSTHIFRKDIITRFATRQYEPTKLLHLLDSKLYFPRSLERSCDEKNFLTHDQSQTNIWLIWKELTRPEVYSWPLKWKVRKYKLLNKRVKLVYSYKRRVQIFFSSKQISALVCQIQCIYVG